MTDEKRTPEVIYDEIVAGAKHPKSKKAIGNVKAACDELEGADIPIIVSRVGNLTANREGGPTTPSLRNNQEYVAYVHARGMRQELPPTAKNGPQPTYRTNDPEINAVIYMLEARCNEAENKLRCVTSSLANSGDFDLGEFLKQKKLTLASLPPGQIPPPEPKPTNGKLGEILAKFLDPQHLQAFGLVLDNGRIKSPERNSRVFLEKPEVDILRAELGRQRSNPSVTDIAS